MRKYFPAAAAALLLQSFAVHADPGPASACPPYSLAGSPNLAVNPSFEAVGPNGSPTTWVSGDPFPAPSAASGWYMHSSNAGAQVTSALITTHAPGPNGARMLHYIAGGNEGGIYQQLGDSPAKLMFSAWVFVNSGHVELQPQGGPGNPVAWSTKIGEWEELRVCTDGSVPTGYFFIGNQNPRGGDFYVDRIEIRKIP